MHAHRLSVIDIDYVLFSTLLYFPICLSTQENIHVSRHSCMHNMIFVRNGMISTTFPDCPAYSNISNQPVETSSWLADPTTGSCMKAPCFAQGCFVSWYWHSGDSNSWIFLLTQNIYDIQIYLSKLLVASFG